MLRRRPLGLLGLLAPASAFFLGGCWGGGSEEDAVGAALSDGVVTEAEYQAAVDAQVVCMEARGFEARAFRSEGGLLWGVSASVPSDGDGGAESAALDACYDTHVAAIEREYFQAHVPTGAERDALFVEFAECLESFGIHGAIPSWTEHQVVNAIIEANGHENMDGLACLNQFAVLYPEGILPE